MKKNLIGILSLAFTMILAGCSSDNVSDQNNVDNAVYSSGDATSSANVSEETDISDVESTTNVTNEEEVSINTASVEDVQRLIDEVECPDIRITEDSTSEEIMLAGKTAGIYFGKATDEYFGYGNYYNWKYDYDESIGHYRSDGLYIDKANDVYAPMDYAKAKEFLINRLLLTEKGFDDLCENSPGSYYDVNGSLCVIPGDGGQAGWSYSQIVDYEMDENELGEKTVTYNCERVGTAEEWGYDEDKVEPFTFRLAYEDNLWKLDGVSYGEGFFELMWLENNAQNLSE